MKSHFIQLLSLSAALLSFGVHAAACPRIGGLPDVNCDGKSIVVVIGDSLVAGVGDSVNRGSGGYVLRAQQRFSDSTVFNEGTAGLRATALLKRLRKTFAPGQTSPLRQKLISADLVVLDLGRNDRWFFKPPAHTLRNLQRIRRSIATEVTATTGFSPLIVQAVLMYPNRGSQGPWVKELNGLILKSHTTTAPADLRFDLVSKRLLNPDNIHPSSRGYAAMAKIFISYLLKNYPRHVTAIRSDADNDGLYDEFEAIRYGTSPTNPDSDGDGLKDGEDPSPAG
jgi:lysophospholipase L1-like esterase